MTDCNCASSGVCAPDCPAGLPAWPGWLPKPLQSGYGYSLRRPDQSSEMEVGTLRRREFDVDQGEVNCNLILDPREVAFLEAFERDLLRQGQEWFSIPLWLGGELKPCPVRFKGRPKFGPLRGQYTTASFTLDFGARRLPPLNLEAGDSESLPRWPESMPSLQKGGYSYDLADRALTSDSDMPKVKRVDFSIDEVNIKARLVLNPSEAAFLEAFERDVLNQGCRWFLLPLWISGEMREYKVRFKSRLKLAQVFGRNSIYDLDLEMGRRNLLDAVSVAWLLFFSPEEIVHLSDRLHGILNYQLPGALSLPADLTEGFYD